MTRNFTLAEFTRSGTASRRGIDNNLPRDLLPHAEETLQMMERIRAHLSMISRRDIPIQITSGYRCAELNAAVGSRSSSDHLTASACDFVAPAFGNPYAVATALAPVVGLLEIGQLILEFGEWVHCGVPLPEKQVNRIITINRAGVTVGIKND